nr:DNA cytosine methyltransferase [uncultured Macellibacteroides sp.]
MSLKKEIGVIDLFCGIGGLSHGMYNKGFDIIAGFDIDKSCKYAFEKNNNTDFYSQDINNIDNSHIKYLFKEYKIKIIAGCAPCQPFSSYAYKVKDKDEGKYGLLYSFARIVQEVLPDIVTMENVQQILSFNKPVLKDFVDVLEKCGYHVDVKKVFCPDYGIPQTRKRLVLLASRLGEISLLPPTHTPDKYVTVRNAIGMLPPIKAGEKCKDDPLHISSDLGELNMKRIIATPYGGGWKDWPEELILNCHKKKSGKSYGSVYGRMVWDEPSPTMTTLCTGLGNGRFGHPVQNRAISIREAALLQTFPLNYMFFSPEEKISMAKASRYIGNAVPPKLGEVIAESILNHLKDK